MSSIKRLPDQRIYVGIDEDWPLWLFLSAVNVENVDSETLRIRIYGERLFEKFNIILGSSLQRIGFTSSGDITAEVKISTIVNKYRKTAQRRTVEAFCKDHVARKFIRPEDEYRSEIWREE